MIVHHDNSFFDIVHDSSPPRLHKATVQWILSTVPGSRSSGNLSLRQHPLSLHGPVRCMKLLLSAATSISYFNYNSDCTIVNWFFSVSEGRFVWHTFDKKPVNVPVPLTDYLRYSHAASAAIAPSAHAVVTWRTFLDLQSPATKMPGVFVLQSSALSKYP